MSATDVPGKAATDRPVSWQIEDLTLELKGFGMALVLMSEAEVGDGRIEVALYGLGRRIRDNAEQIEELLHPGAPS